MTDYNFESYTVPTLAYQEISSNSLVRYTDINGITLSLSDPHEICIIDANPPMPPWALQNMSYIAVGYVSRNLPIVVTSKDGINYIDSNNNPIDVSSAASLTPIDAGFPAWKATLDISLKSKGVAV